MGQKWLVGVRKWLELLPWQWNTECKNIFTGGYCSSAGGVEGYKSITGYEVVIVMPVRWPGKGRLTGDK